MLFVPSLRRMAHSTSLRATGSLMVFWRSSACADLPRRAALTASFSAAASAEDIGSPAATANRAEGVAARGAAAVAFGLASAFAGALAGLGLGTGTAPAESACTATTTAPPASSAVNNREGLDVVKASSLLRFRRNPILIHLIRLTNT